MENKSIWGDIPVRVVAGKEIPEAILLENGVKFTEKWIKETESKRCYLPETVLRKMAAEIAENITFRTYVDGSSKDITRKSTDAEQDIIYKLAYSALLGLNYGEVARQCESAENAILNAIEYAIIMMIPHVNSYDTLYIPLRKMLAFWRESQEDVNKHFRA